MIHRWSVTWFLIAGLLLAACGPSGATPDPQSGELTLIQNDDDEGMNFSPETIVVTAGQTVRIILENHGSKDHEFMVGQTLVYTEMGAPNGFEVDFFEGIEDQVHVELGAGTMLMIDGKTVAMGGEDMPMGGDDEMGVEGEGDMGMEEEAGEGGMPMEGDGHDDEEGTTVHLEDHAGWMVMDNAGSGATIIEFIVPEDRIGVWEMGCFEDDGTHYEDGMRGTLIVRAP